MPRTIQTIGLAPADELARIVRAQLTASGEPTPLQLAALDALELRASSERESSRLLGRLVALDARMGHMLAGALEYAACESDLPARRHMFGADAPDYSSAPLYALARHLRGQLAMNEPDEEPEPAEPSLDDYRGPDGVIGNDVPAWLDR